MATSRRARSMGEPTGGSITVPEPWWSRRRADKRIWPRLTTLVHEQYREQGQRYLQFRKNIAVREYGYRAAEKVIAKDRWLDDTVLAFNRAQNATDTLVATVGAAKLAPMFGCDGGDWFERQDAEQATRALAGLFASVDYDEIAEDCCYDAADTGCWFIKVEADRVSGRVNVCRINPLDVLFDEAEVRYRAPRCLYHRLFVDRYVAAATWGIAAPWLYGGAEQRRERILRAPAPTGMEVAAPTSNDSLVEVIEAWHLPNAFIEEDEDEESEPDVTRKRWRGDGMHALLIDGCDLIAEPWTKEGFPFVIGTPRKSREGVWGIPMMRQLMPGQREAELLDGKLQRTHKRMGGSHWLMPRQGNIVKRQVTNDAGDLLDYDAPYEPKPIAPEPAAAQTYQYREQVGVDMLKYVGVPQMAAQGTVPAGLQQASGKALQTFVDEGAKYLSPWFRAREKTTKQLAILMLDTVAELCEDNPEFSTAYEEVNGGWEKMQWKRIVDNRRRYIIKVDPVNALSLSMSGKLSIIGQWYDQKIIDSNEYRRMSEIPDLRSSTAQAISDEQLIEKKLTLLLRSGKPMYPEPFQDLELTLSIGRKFYNAREVDGLSAEQLAPLRQYLTDVQAAEDERKAKQAAAQAPPPGAAPPEGMPPGAPPGAPPPEGMPPEMAGAPPPPPGPPGAMPPMAA